MPALATTDRPTLSLSPFQSRVLAVPENYDLFLGGGRGGGKSWALALLILRHVEQYGAQARALFVRRSFPGVTDFEATTRELFGLVYGPAARYNATAHIWRFPNGGTLQLDQMEGHADFAKYQGKSFSLICCDEAGQYDSPAVLDLLRSCLRAPAPMVPRMVLAANPGGPGHHWLARRHVLPHCPWVPYQEPATDRTFVSCPSTFRDNTALDHGDYERQLRAATTTDPELGRAWLEGDWHVIRGAYFAAVLGDHNMMEPWRRDWPRMVRNSHADPSSNWRFYLAHDFGSSAPSVTLVMGRSPGASGPDGTWYPRGSIVVLDEYSSNAPGQLNEGMGYTIPVLAEKIKDLANHWYLPARGCADDACFAHTGHGSGSIADEFRAHGVHFTPARKADRRTGWERLKMLMADAGKPDRPGLYISRACSYLWETLPILPRDPRHPDDVDSRGPDHGADALRYGALWTPNSTIIEPLRI